jgi:hypothetical protein
MDIPWFQRFLGKMDPFHIKFGLEGNGALEPWKFHGIEFQTSNIGPSEFKVIIKDNPFTQISLRVLCPQISNPT